MELTHTALDEVWKADGGGGARGSYPQARMAHLFDVIGAALCRCVVCSCGGISSRGSSRSGRRCCRRHRRGVQHRTGLARKLGQQNVVAWGNLGFETCFYGNSQTQEKRRRSSHKRVREFSSVSVDSRPPLELRSFSLVFSARGGLCRHDS